MRKVCGNCGRTLADDDLFCIGCGAKQEPAGKRKRCVRCGSLLAEDDLFCGSCGAKQEPPFAAGSVKAETMEESASSPAAADGPANPPEPIDGRGGNAKRGKKRIVFVLCGIAAAAALTAAALLLIGNRSDGSSDAAGITQADPQTSRKDGEDSSAESDGDTPFTTAAADTGTAPDVVPDGTSAETEPVSETPPDWYALYEEKIGEYTQALTMGVDAFEAKYDFGDDCRSINAYMVRSSYYYGGSVGYTFFDIDGNGTAELLFSNPERLIDIYTEKDGAVIKLFEDCYFGERSRVHVLSDGRILTEGSSGASAGECELYRLDGDTGKLLSEGAYYFDGNGSDPNMTGYTYMKESEYGEMLGKLLDESVFDEFDWTVLAKAATETGSESSHTHSFANWIDNEDGLTHSRSCSCGEKETESHHYGDLTSIKHPTETDPGLATYRCTKCGATKSESIPRLQHTHSFGNWQNGGSSGHTRSCSCGETETEAHTFDSGRVTKEPTETDIGITLYTCTKCGATKSESIPRLQHTHSFGNWTTGSSTVHTRACSCGETETEAHTFDSGKVTKEPTIFDTGVKTYTCTKCGAAKTETIAKLQHTHSYGFWSNDNGSTHSRSCSCGDTETETHSFDSGTVTKEPTYNAEGVRTCTCRVCGATKTETIPKLDPPAATNPSNPATREYDYQCICNYCKHDDGIMHLVLENGVKTDVIWVCSSCKRENWNYVTWTW